jgi:hypothetical protein
MNIKAVALLPADILMVDGGPHKIISVKHYEQTGIHMVRVWVELRWFPIIMRAEKTVEIA